MQIVRLSDNTLALHVSEKQLRTLQACVRESFATLDRGEYELRIGTSFQEASELSRRLKELMDEQKIDL